MSDTEVLEQILAELKAIRVKLNWLEGGAFSKLEVIRALLENPRVGIQSAAPDLPPQCAKLTGGPEVP